MKSNFWVIVKKELTRVFTDRRMVISNILLPGILIYALYSLMGGALQDLFGTEEGYRYRVAAVNMPAVFGAVLPEDVFDVREIDSDRADAERGAVKDGALDALIVFPGDFIEPLSPAQGKAPNVEIYYNSADSGSGEAYQALTAVLDAYESAQVNLFDVNADADAQYDLADEKDATGMLFSSMLPMLLMIFLFSGCMAVAPESIAGEKERGTLATILVTPTRRSQLAAGKIVAISIVALASAASSTIGTLLSMPKLMGGAIDGMSAAYYSAADYLTLTAVIFSTVLVLVGVISMISAYAKTIKEAQTTTSALMIVVMVIAVTAMFGNGAKTDLLWYCIPLYNSVQMMVGVFAFAVTPGALAVTLAVNILVAAAAGFVLTKMFNSETLMFRR